MQIPFTVCFLALLALQSRVEGQGVPVAARQSRVQYIDVGHPRRTSSVAREGAAVYCLFELFTNELLSSFQRLVPVSSNTTLITRPDKTRCDADLDGTAEFLDGSGIGVDQNVLRVTLPFSRRRSCDMPLGTSTGTTHRFRQASLWHETHLHAEGPRRKPVDDLAKAGPNRDLSIRIQAARIQDADVSGSNPYVGVDVLVRTRDQSWRNTTDSGGMVHFTSIPCGGTVRIKLLNVEQPFRTLAFPCQPTTPLGISAFVADACRSRLQLLAKPANLTMPLSGIVTQHIRFKKCAAAAMISGFMAEGGIDNYLLTAKKGQEMSIHVVPVDEQNPVLFDVYLRRDPGVYIQALSAKAGCIANENVKDFRGVLPESGEYVISVYAEGGNGRYFLDLIIQ